MQFNQSEFLCEVNIPKDELIVSRTDLKGIITFVNDTFVQISGYKAEELIGQPHNIVRHPDMPKSTYKELWKSLEEKRKWSGFIKNLRKDFSFYWVFAEISGVYKNAELVEYKSIRVPVSFEDKVYYQKKYDKMRKQNGEYVRTISYEKPNS